MTELIHQSPGLFKIMLFGSEFKNLKIKTGDAEINLVQGGSGPPLLLIHGYPQTHVIWHIAVFQWALIRKYVL